MTTNVVANKAIGNVIPTGVANVDPVSGIVNGIDSCKYTQITTSGTTTVSANPCVVWSALVYVLATATGGIQILDGTSALTGTFTATAVNQIFGPAAGTNSPHVAVRCQTSLVIVTTGTAANSWNILWD